MTMYYDFYGSDSRDDDDNYILPLQLRSAGLQQIFDSDESLLGRYNGHDHTRLHQNKDDAYKVIRRRSDLLSLINDHLINRINLEELYSTSLQNTIRGAPTAPLYLQPNHVTLNAHRLRLNNDTEYGDRNSYLFREILDQNESDKNTCLWNILIKEFSNGRYPIKKTVDEMMRCANLSEKVRLCDLDHIERCCLVAEG